MRTFNVHVAHDADANLWWVESSDIPGLNVEAASYEALLEVVLDAAPELIEFNVKDADADDLSIPLAIQHVAVARRIKHAA